jgi:hypothetical protein
LGNAVPDRHQIPYNLIVPKPSRKPTKSSPRSADDPQTVETQAAELMMAGWGVALLTTLICEVAAALLYLFAGLRPVSVQLRTLTGLFHFAALIVGLVALVMIPVLFKVRREPPPPAIVTLAVVIGGLPLAGLALQLFFA